MSRIALLLASLMFALLTAGPALGGVKVSHAASKSSHQKLRSKPPVYKAPKLKGNHKLHKPPKAQKRQSSPKG